MNNRTINPQYEVTDFTTIGADREETPGLWAGHVSENHGDMRFGFGDRRNFSGSTCIQRSHSYQLTEFVSEPVEYRRTTRHASGNGDRSAKVVIPIEGTLTLSQRRDEVTIDAGSAGLVRMDLPMNMAHAQGARALILDIPDGTVTRRIADNAPLLLDRQRPLVSMFTQQARQVAAHRDTMTAFEFVTSTEILFTLLEAVIEQAGAESTSDLFRIARSARSLIRARSDDPSLTPEKLAESVGYSLSYLHKALKAEAAVSVGPGAAGHADPDGVTPAKLLRAARLEKARDRLRNPLNRSIADIAYDSGFNSLTAFRDAFARRYGMSPSRAREQYLAGHRDPGPERPASVRPRT